MRNYKGRSAMENIFFWDDVTLEEVKEERLNRTG